MGKRQRGSALHQQLHGGRQVLLLLFDQGVPPLPELVGVFHLPCYETIIFPLRNNAKTTPPVPCRAFTVNCIRKALNVVSSTRRNVLSNPLGLTRCVGHVSSHQETAVHRLGQRQEVCHESQG